jgi:hypothetical protein
LDLVCTQDYVEYEGFRYLAGYLAFRLRPIVPNLGDPTARVTLSRPARPGNVPDWISMLSEGGLIQPSEELVKKVLEMDKLFQEFDGKDFYREEGAVKSLSLLIQQQLGVHEKIATLFSRVRLFIRIRSMNEERAAQAKKLNDITIYKY